MIRRAALRRSLGAVVLAALTAPSAAADIPPASPAPARGPVAAARADRNATCEGCHVEIAAEWRASLHRQAFTDPPFTRALAIEPLPFCRACHAPEGDPNGMPPTRAARDGVSCVTCHLPGNDVLASVLARTDATPHPVLRDPRFASPAACAGCHEFTFPDARTHSDAESMQLTVSEHARSPYAARSCASCHMPLSGEGPNRHRNHSFAATRSPEALAAALSVRVAREGDAAVFSLTPVGVGHALPTGDLFRRIELAVESIDSSGKVRARGAKYLGRQVGVVRRGPGLYTHGLASDTRLTEPAEVAVAIPSAEGAHSVRWRVTYQRIEHPTSRDPSTAISGGDVVLAEGTLPAAE